MMSQSNRPAKKALMIVNPKAGKSRSKTKSDGGLFGAVCVLSAAGYLVDARMTQHRGHAAELAREVGAEYDLVVCCGGDGTLNETVCGLMTCPDRRAASTSAFSCMWPPSAPSPRRPTPCPSL